MAQQQRDRRIRAVLSSSLRELRGAQLSELDISPDGARLDVTAAVLTPQEISPVQVAQMEAQLQRRSGEAVKLIVRSLLSRDVDRRGTVYISDEERNNRELAAASAQQLSAVESELRSQLKDLEGAQLSDLRRDNEGRYLATVETPEVIGPERVTAFQAARRSAWASRSA